MLVQFWAKHRVAMVGPILAMWTSQSSPNCGLPTLDQYSSIHWTNVGPSWRCYVVTSYVVTSYVVTSYVVTSPSERLRNNIYYIDNGEKHLMCDPVGTPWALSTLKRRKREGKLVLLYQCLYLVNCITSDVIISRRGSLPKNQRGTPLKAV